MGERARRDVPMRMVLGATILALGAFGGAAATLGAQGAGVVREARQVTATPVEFPEPFSAVTRMVELRHGRVLLYDGTDNRLGIVDFTQGSFVDAARRGAGPLEFRAVFHLLRITGDTIMTRDASNSRALLFSPDGRPARTIPFNGGGRLYSMMSPQPQAVDASGRWYAAATDFEAARQREVPTYPLHVLRIDPRSSRTDTVAVIAHPHDPRTSFRDRVLTLSSWGLVSGDAWGVFADGTVIVVRGETLQPELFPLGRRAPVLAPIPFTPLRVTAAAREAHLDSLRRFAQATRAMDREGRRVEFSAKVIGPDSWQEFRPPLLADFIPIDSRGRAWVHVLDGDGASGERYELLDAQGRLVDAIRLPKGTKFAAMGTNSWYGTREDEDGLVYLQRFPLP